MDFPQTDDYRALFLNSTPLMDVRAPVEFQQGAFPYTENLPLMNDAERHDVGIRYKQRGQDEAVQRGHELVQGEVKQQRVDRWADYFRQHPDGVLYCFRGGLRSKISQQWIYERTGLVYPRVKGGYKAMRRFLIDELETSINRIEPVILSGQTGAGKTRLLQKLPNMLDLEGLYHHRGSVFGNHVTPQPTQIDIENALSIALIKAIDRGHTRLLLEDESANIGHRHLPQSLHARMQHAPIILLEADLAERIELIFQEYITDDLSRYQSVHGESQGFQQWSQKLSDSIDKIQRRLGGVRHKQLKTLLDNALQQHEAGNPEGHRDWIEILLVEYYDPMYTHQINNKQKRIIFHGGESDVLEFLKTRYQIV
ncbi:tRNA 2-selenouridine(34) synthase MnmH [Thiohalophilus sp.]|uniref:tRNA 2-selenouridine(34) synthase MnmH n=1 Tax=Thiohalophilus sp. TaxID=3028392 RepID=UPI002ADA0867|nr:tRNA 2-selenouridine(34) synthase MnmH [Thiohalophilus sp.]